MSVLLPAKYSVRIFFDSSSLFKYVITSHPPCLWTSRVSTRQNPLGVNIVCLWVEESFILSYIWNAHQHLEMNLWILSETVWKMCLVHITDVAMLMCNLRGNAITDRSSDINLSEHSNPEEINTWNMKMFFSGADAVTLRESKRRRPPAESVHPTAVPGDRGHGQSLGWGAGERLWGTLKKGRSLPPFIL